ncbi:UNVERIFIED_CONTAM: ATP-binding cassette domain-containing protein [Microbacterium sp. SLM126]
MLLNANQVSFRYGTADWLYQDLSIECRSGKLVGLAGPSGSGKSTMLDLLGMTSPPGAGEVTLVDDDGAAVASNTPARTSSGAGTNFAWILQSNAVLSGRTVLDNVAVAQLAAGASRAAAHELAKDALTRVGLASLGSARVNEISGGELQRVTVARCLTSTARVILADEPTGQLDSRNTALVADALRELAEDGRIVVVATHDERVMDRCDQLVRLR